MRAAPTGSGRMHLHTTIAHAAHSSALIAFPACMLCIAPVTVRPPTTANPLLMPPIRLVISPTTMPPKACVMMGMNAMGVHPTAARACARRVR